MVKLHLTPYNNGPTGLGTFIDDHNGAGYFQHGAGNDGFCGQFFASLNEGYGVVVFLNSEDGRLLYDVINTVAKVYNWKNFYQEPQRKNCITVPDSILKNYEGVYLVENVWTAIGKRDKEYHYYSNNMPVKMYYSTPTCFFNIEFSSAKEFIKDEKGNITGFTRRVDGTEYPKATRIFNPDTLHLEGNMLGDIGWYLLENRNFRGSLAYYKRGIQLYPGDLNMLLNAAHVYLFNNDYKNAIAIYKAHLKDNIRPGLSWEDALKIDLIYFKEHYYDVKLFDKVFTELKIKKPKGY